MHSNLNSIVDRFVWFDSLVVSDQKTGVVSRSDELPMRSSCLQHSDGELCEF